MKKLFLLLTALALSLTATMYAVPYQLGAENETSAYLFGENGQISGRNNAPQAEAYYNWDYIAGQSHNSYFNELAYGITSATVGYTTYYVVKYQWSTNVSGGLPLTVLSIAVNASEESNFGSWYNPYDKKNYYMIPKGTYTLGGPAPGNHIISSNNNNDYWPSGYKGSLFKFGSYTSYPYAGTLNVDEGADGPYITTTSKITIQLQQNNPNSTQYGDYYFTIGSEAQYQSVTIRSNNNTMGSASYSYKSGYVYPTRSKEFKLNSVYTISATANPGYHFTNWSDDGTQSHDITITGSNTYTANFDANTYTVHFDGNGSTGGTMSDQSHTYGQSKALTTNAFTRTGHAFRGWATSADRANAGTVDYTDGQSVSNLTTTNNGTYNLYAVWKINTYTVTVESNNNDYGTVSQASVANVPYGTNITTGTGENANKVTINGTTVTANKTTDTDEYTYAFTGWTNGTATVNGTTTVTANFTQTKKQYTLTWDFAGGETATAEGDYTSGTIDWGTAIIAPAAPTKTNYTFTGWKSNISGEVETPSVMPKQALTYTAQWESSVTPEIVLNEEGGQHTLGGVATNKTLDDLASDYASRDVNVTIDRTLYGGSWNTIVFPFSVEDMEGNVLDGSLYELNTSTTTATSEGMVINFEPLSGDGKIVAGKPYLIRTSAEVNLNSYPFNGVRLTAEFSSVTDGDAVDFVPIKEKEKINYDAENLAIFIVGNRLYYPNKTTGTNLRGFRAYLRIKNGTYYGGPVRIRIADTGETITLDEEQEIETRKYVEDGILIIERGGVRYDAQGKRME